MSDNNNNNHNNNNAYFGGPLSPEEKQVIMRGRCNFLLLMMLSTVAVVCSGTAAGYCDFAQRKVSYENGYDVTRVCQELNQTDNDFDLSACTTFLQDHGVGYYAWYATVPVNQKVCISYTLWVPGRGYVEPDFDAAFTASRVFAIMANICGLVGWFSLMFASCCPLDNNRLKGLSCYFIVACLCQAFTFLMHASNVCEAGFLGQYYPNVQATGVQNVSCGLGSGGKLSVTATVLFFVCSGLCPLAAAPLPIGYQRAATQETNAADADQP